jgi:hypothetical protein
MAVGDRAAAEEWIRQHVRLAGPIEQFREKPWATVLRVPVAGGAVWFKECAPVQAFEPVLTARLSRRWPDRVAEVLGYDPARAWLLLADAGELVSWSPGPPRELLDALPRYAELQRGEVTHAAAHLAAGVPDLRLATWPDRYQDLAARELPLAEPEIRRLRRHAPRFAERCAQLACAGIPDSVQHDDLHPGSLYAGGGLLRILDWGDTSVSHPFVSLVVTFRFLEQSSGVPPGDPAYDRVRDAYLEPWGSGREEAFDLAIRAGAFAYAFASARQRDALPGAALRARHDQEFAVVLRRALALAD